MAIPRLFVDAPIRLAHETLLPAETAAHGVRVLRLRAGDRVTLFNGEGGEYQATIRRADKRGVAVMVDAHQAVERESLLSITLAQGISKGDRMDYTIQKAVELGVTRIVPLETERTTVRLDQERVVKRLVHWRRVAISACEQCGRNRVPAILPVMPVAQWCERPVAGLQLVLAPEAKQGLRELPELIQEVTLLVGPEGGWADAELRLAERSGYRSLRLGPRVLRTETAPIAAIAVIQAFWGDLAGSAG